MILVNDRINVAHFFPGTGQSQLCLAYNGMSSETRAINCIYYIDTDEIP